MIVFIDAHVCLDLEHVHTDAIRPVVIETRDVLHESVTRIEVVQRHTYATLAELAIIEDVPY